jgi:hypothetical protein
MRLAVYSFPFPPRFLSKTCADGTEFESAHIQDSMPASEYFTITLSALSK